MPKKTNQTVALQVTPLVKARSNGIHKNGLTRYDLDKVWELGRTMPEVPKDLIEPQLSETALYIGKTRYARRDEKGEPVESAREMFWRVAYNISAADLLFNPDKAEMMKVAKEFYSVMATQKFIPNTPTMLNAGKPMQQLSACFVLPVEDNMKSIAKTLVDMVMIHKSGGGCISADARVWSTFCGIEPIETLFARATADGRYGIKQGSGMAYDISDLNIKTVSMNPETGQTGLRKVSHVWKYNVPANNQLLVTTSEGVTVQTSSWHPFMVLRNTKLVEVRADELVKGDIVLGPDRADKYWPWKKEKTVGDLIINSDLGWLIGFTLGDGSFGYVKPLRQYRVRWFSGTKDVLEKLQVILSRLGIKVSTQKDKRGLLSVSTLNQKLVFNLLEACGLEKFGPKDNLIRVPELIAKSPLSVVKSFLAGLMDSDGYVASDGSPSYCSVSKSMVEDLAALVSLLGYQPSVTSKAPHGKGKLTTYNIQICPLPQVNQLAQDILPFMANKLRSSRLVSSSRKQTSLPLNFHTWRDKFVELKLAVAKGKKGHSLVSKELSILASHKRLGRDRIQALAQVMSTKDKKLAEFLIRVAKVGQEIKDVRKASVPKDYYDLSVEGWNTYAAGQSGMLMIHNTGFSFSRLRPYGDVIGSSGGTTVGPTSFLQAYNDVTSQVKQGGVRRGANMGILHINHPDILRFAVMKVDEFSLTNFNISVTVTEEWMEQVKKDEKYVESEPNWEEIIEEIKAAQAIRDVDLKLKKVEDGVAKLYDLVRATHDDEGYELINPRNNQISDRLNAKKVFLLITQLAWHYGDPGMIMIDRINKSGANPTPQIGMIEATNPCLTADTWIHTNLGPRMIKDLIGIPFLARVNGNHYLSGPEGFFKTGKKRIIKLQTIEGYSLRLTPNHLLKKVDVKTNNAEWCEVSSLNQGDYIELNNHRSNTNWQGKYSYNEGYLIGLLIGDGTLKKDKAVLSVWDKQSTVFMPTGAQSVMKFAFEGASGMPHRSDFSGWMSLPSRNEYRMSLGYIKHLANELGMAPRKKIITEHIEKASSDFYKGLLRGIFDADGSVQGYEGSHLSVRLAQSDLGCLEAVQRMLLRLGIFSHIYKYRRKAGKKLLPNGKGGYKEYNVKAQHELVITRDNIELFNELIGFANSEKAAKLQNKLKSHSKIGFYNNKFIARVDYLKNEAKTYVYDVHIPGVNYYDSNGIISHNCGEQPLLPYDACTLGSVNLGKFVKDGVIDWEGLGEAVRVAVHFLDNVLDMNNYPIQEIADMTRKIRRIGLGVMGYADMLVQMGLGYNTLEGLKVAEEVMEFIQQQAKIASIELAKVRGVFPGWTGSIFDPKSPYFLGEALKVRNGAITTIAPTGTISMLADANSGIEPFFGLSYAKNTIEGKRLFTVNPYLLKTSQEEGWYSEELMEKIEQNHGSLQGIPDVPEKWQKVFVVTHDISPDWHVKTQAAFQRQVDNAISKTINFPHEATVEDVRQAYLSVYELGCKGITIYRDGSREKQILETKKDNSYYDQLAGGSNSFNVGSATQVEHRDDVTRTDLPPVPLTELGDRPIILRGRTYKIITPIGEAFITVNRDSVDNPFEVFITIGKAGMHTGADAEAIGRLISLALRVSRPNSKDIARKIISQLKGIGGSSQVGFGKDRVMSLADAVAKALAEDLSLNGHSETAESIPLNLTASTDNLEPTGSIDSNSAHPYADLCPQCGVAAFVFEEGCKKCHSCGYSMC